MNTANLSDLFWFWMGSTVDGMPWTEREVPGLILIGGYLVTGAVLAYGLLRREDRATPYWRWAVLVLLLQLAALVPLKMAGYWLFNVQYWVFIPEHGWNV